MKDNCQSLEIERLADELADLMERLSKMQGRMHDVIRVKLHAMRIADVGGMETAVARESELVGQVVTLNRRRIEIVTELGPLLDMPVVRNPEQVTLRAVARVLPAGRRARLTRVADDLRDRMLRVAEANRVVDMVSRRMLDWFKELFEIIAHADVEPVTYSADGRSGDRQGVRVLDALV